MNYPNVLRIAVAVTAGAGTLTVLKPTLSDWKGFHPKLFGSAFAASVETTKWDNNWDRRSHIKSKVTRNIILIRHGQYNLSGQNDEEKYLTTLGKEQAILTGLRLKELGLDKRITIFLQSTMCRANETCKLIHKELGNESIPIESSDLLREGAPVEPEPPVIHWSPEPQTFFVDGSRIETAFRRFIHRADDDQMDESYEVIVCHANVIRYFVCRALQLPPEAWLRMSLRHASITHLSIRPNGRISLRALGDSGHLPADKLTFE